MYELVCQMKVVETDDQQAGDRKPEVYSLETVKRSWKSGYLFQ